MGLLDGKVAFVTAAGGNIAGATARLFAEEGAAVACADVAEEDVRKTAADIEAAGGRAIAMVCDVTDEDAVKECIARTVAELGPLTTLFNAAAHSEQRFKVADMPVDMWRRTIDVDLTGMFIVCKYAIPEILKAGGGSIVNISSTYGKIAAAERPAYCSAKGGVRMLTKSIAVDYAADNIRCNSILPGPIEGPRMLQRNPSIEAVVARHGQRLHFKRLGQSIEIARTALFLASDESSYTNGADMAVDAGYTAF